MRTTIVVLLSLALCASAFAAGTGDWTRGTKTVTLDTRGINAGRPEGRAALEAVERLNSQSAILGNKTSPSQARAFNAEAQRVAEQVNTVAAQPRTEAARRAESDRYTRQYIHSHVK